MAIIGNIPYFQTNPFIVSMTRNLGTFQGWDAGPGGNIDKDVFHLIIWEARGSSNRLQMAIYSGFSHLKWWCSIAMLNYSEGTPPNCSLHSTHTVASHSSIGRGAGPLWLKHSGKAFRAWQLSGDVNIGIFILPNLRRPVIKLLNHQGTRQLVRLC